MGKRMTFNASILKWLWDNPTPSLVGPYRTHARRGEVTHACMRTSSQLDCARSRAQRFTRRAEQDWF